jgi:hypothetical protein
VECSGGVGGGLDLGKEAWVNGGGGVDGDGLDRDVWVVWEGDSGLNFVVRYGQGRGALIAICQDPNDSDSTKNRIEHD